MHWLKKGYINTRYFHSSNISRKKVKSISSLKDDEGRKVDTQNGICELTVNYFAQEE